MSTEHVSEHDLEYGPTPPGAKHEHTDIDVSVGYKFALWLSVAMVISIGIVYGTFWFFEGQARSTDALAQKSSARRFEGRLIVQADESIPFHVLQKVMYTSQTVGFYDITLAVIQK